MKSQARVRVRRIAIVGLALAVVGGTALGYVRIVIGGETLYWNSNTIGWQLSTPGWDDLSEDGSHRAAVRHGRKVGKTFMEAILIFALMARHLPRTSRVIPAI